MVSYLEKSDASLSTPSHLSWSDFVLYYGEYPGYTIPIGRDFVL